MVNFGIELIGSTNTGTVHSYVFLELAVKKYFIISTKSSAINTFINRVFNYPEITTEQVLKISNEMEYEVIDIFKDEYLLNQLSLEWIERYNFCDPLFYEY